MHHLILSIRFISSTQSCHLIKGMEKNTEGKWKPHPFSIAAILGDNVVTVTEESPQAYQQIDNGGRTAKYEGNGTTNEKNKEVFHSTKNDNTCNTPSYSWLHCSRYNPPRVHRTKRRRGATTNPSRQPRIPFSQLQQETLESNYKANRYLSSDAVKELSNILCLPEQRIKIWFQNRRARERRENTRDQFE